jgi:hypothetical protein
MLLPKGCALAEYVGGRWDGARGLLPDHETPPLQMVGQVCLLGHWHPFTDGCYELVLDRWTQLDDRMTLVFARYRWVQTDTAAAPTATERDLDELEARSDGAV